MVICHKISRFGYFRKSKIQIQKFVHCQFIIHIRQVYNAFNFFSGILKKLPMRRPGGSGGPSKFSLGSGIPSIY